MLPTVPADIDPLGVAPRQLEQPRIDQAVVEDHLRLLQPLDPDQRHQIAAAGPSAASPPRPGSSSVSTCVLICRATTGAMHRLTKAMAYTPLHA